MPSVQGPRHTDIITENRSRIFAYVISGVTTSGVHDQRDRQFQNRPRVFYQVARVLSVAMTRENIHYI